MLLEDQHDITTIIEENQRRNAVIGKPYRPVTGEGAPLPRTYHGDGEFDTFEFRSKNNKKI